MSAPGAIVTVPMNTTMITVNGLSGSRFLAVLGAKFPDALPPALASLVDGERDSVEVATDLAEEVADLVARVIADGEVDSPDAEPPLLFSPGVGEHVAIVRDALFEFQVSTRRGPRIWRFVPRGTRGRVIAHEGEIDRVLLEPNREIAYVRPRSMTGVRFWSAAR